MSSYLIFFSMIYVIAIVLVASMMGRYLYKRSELTEDDDFTSWNQHVQQALFVSRRTIDEEVSNEP